MLSQLKDYWFKYRQKKRLQVWHRVVWLYGAIFLVWGLYRLLSPFPLWFEELVLKGLVFGAPVFWIGIKWDGWRLRDFGITNERLFQSVYLGLGLGLLLGLVGQVGNMVRHGGLTLSTHGVSSEEVGGFLLLALVTAFWEGLLFYGYILKKLQPVLKENKLVLIVAGMYVLIHFPALIVLQQLGISELVVSAILLFMLGVGNSILMLRMRNLAAPILAQAVWGVTVFLFR